MTAIREEDLNKVNGGYINEVVDDSKIFHSINSKWYDKFNKFETFTWWFYCSNDVSKHWKSYGIICEPHVFEANKYSRKGQRIPREDALIFLKPVHRIH